MQHSRAFGFQWVLAAMLMSITADVSAPFVSGSLSIVNFPDKSITETERAYVRQHLPKAIAWFSHWYQPLKCEKSGLIIDESFIARDNGKKVQVLLEVSEGNIYATVNALRYRITFKRTGLVPFSTYGEAFCAETYEIEKEIRLRRLQGASSTEELEEEDRQTLMRLGIVRPSDAIEYREEIELLMPEVHGSRNTRANDDAEAGTKESFYRLILDAAANEPAFGCEKGRTAELWIPDFSEHDPGVYVRSKERPGWQSENATSVVLF